MPTIFLFFVFFGTFHPPNKGGGVGWGRTARQGNEINTARRLLKIGFAPVDLLYSESLTKSIKKSANRACAAPPQQHHLAQGIVLGN